MHYEFGVVCIANRINIGFPFGIYSHNKKAYVFPRKVQLLLQSILCHILLMEVTDSLFLEKVNLMVIKSALI